MARYKVILAYDGTEFSGSQRQAEVRTVQYVFERALRQLGWEAPSITLAGRTDAGVHARGQVAAFDLDWKHPAEALLRALNAQLPKDLAAREVSLCGDDFHPRFDADWRSYRYQIFCDPVQHPLRERYAWRVWPEPDFGFLRAAAEELIGIFDYACFGRPTRHNGSTVREIRSAQWEQDRERFTFEVTANAFLYHMVRRMTFVQVAIGQGKLAPGIISRVLNEPKDQSVFQGLAPPNGLSLIEVSYPSDRTDRE